MRLLLRSNLALGFLLSALAVAFFGCEEKIEMNDREIERMLSESDDLLLSPEILDKVERREYPFVRRYLTSPDPDVRNNAIFFIVAMDQPWGVPLLFEALRDPVDSHRAVAAQALRRHVTADNRQRLYDEIAWQDSSYTQNEDRVTADLVLALGVAADESDLPALEEMRSRESDREVLTAYQMALARCGHPGSVQAIRDDLEHREPEIRKEALDKVIYITHSAWIPYVAPLLLDERVALYYEIGSFEVSLRVCDFALNTLIEIDAGSEFSRPEDQIRAYPDDVIQRAREVYDVLPPKGDG